MFTVDDVVAAAARLPRPSVQAYAYDLAKVRPAAALVPVLDASGEAGLVITKRPATMTYHRDDWVFPGGRIERGEEAADASRREMEEELGVPRTDVDVVGELDTHGPFVTGFLLRVFLGVVASDACLRPDPHEVEAVRVVPLSLLMADGAHWTGPLPPDHDPGPSPDALEASPARGSTGALRYFDIGDGATMWGTQGSILWNLLSHLTAVRLEA